MTEIKVLQFPESVTDGEVAAWHFSVGDRVQRDQVLVAVDTDKVVLEVPAPADGILTAIYKETGETVLAEEPLGEFQASKGGASAEMPTPAGQKSPAQLTGQPAGDALVSPAAKKIAEENNIDLREIAGSGRGGRVTKEDVLKTVAHGKDSPAPSDLPADSLSAVHRDSDLPSTVPVGERVERRVPMTRLRARIADRLLEAQQTAALLTTFNEIDMQVIMDLRTRYKDEFATTHDGIRLGFMSFFVRASVEALKRFPAVNASIDGRDVVYHGYQDIGVAVSSSRGLVVPVIRDADGLTLAQVEAKIRALSSKAQENRLTIAEMDGGTFTISNGGTFGSLLSTPILNPPQTAILGMHKIQERPVAIRGEVVIRPMMYVALTYDHRLIDGQEAVRFLVTIKELLEDPARILLAL